MSPTDLLKSNIWGEERWTHQGCRGGEGCSTPLLDTGESTRVNTSGQSGFDVLLLNATAVGASIGQFVQAHLISPSSRVLGLGVGAANHPVGHGSFANPLLPSAARNLPGTQQQKWGRKKPFLEPTFLLLPFGQAAVPQFTCLGVCLHQSLNSRSFRFQHQLRSEMAGAVTLSKICSNF